ncbi:MAG: hypothetical protein PHC69_03100 [Ruminiclostridium sp.]|nr:hypothetical protein [Ruminiclostridium sp.]
MKSMEYIGNTESIENKESMHSIENIENIEGIRNIENIVSMEDIENRVSIEIKSKVDKIKRTMIVLTESYNSAIFKAFKDMQHISEKLDNLSSYEKEQVLLDFLGQYQTEKEKIIDIWANTPIDELQGETPSDIINKLKDIDEVFALFLYMSENTEEEIPSVLINKMKQFGSEMSDMLIQLAKSSAEPEAQDHVFAEAVSTLGRMGLYSSVEPMIRLLSDYREDKSKSEYLEEALKNIGAPAIEPIITALENQNFGEFEFSLLYVLAYVGSKAKDERIYRLIRTAFKTANDKMPAIVCFAAYKDGKAVTLLRSYLEKNAESLPKQMMYVLLGTIRDLGGEVKEFMHNLKD